MSATIIVEDGSLVANANSYVTTAELSTYASARGVTITGTAADLLIQAMDYIESRNFIGYRYTQDQALQWPRSYVYIDGFMVAITTIPQLLKDAQCEVALAIDAGNNPLVTLERDTKSETVGPVSVTYMDNTRSQVYVQKIHAKLRKLVHYSGGSAVRA